MRVRAQGEEREVVAIMRTTDDDGAEVVVYWTRLDDGTLEPWAAEACAVTEP